MPNAHRGDEPTALVSALWDLVWSGYITTDTWAALRMLSHATPQRTRTPRTSRHRRGYISGLRASASSTPGMHTLPGRWSRISTGRAGTEQVALALAENLLERYAVISRSAVMAEQIPGGFPALQPLLRTMEDAGNLLRGRFVEGLGAAQFAETSTINQLRELAEHSPQASVAVALSALDPASPFGAILRWPTNPAGSRPTRRQGAMVVIYHGRLVLYLAQGGKELLSFDDESVSEWMHPACAALGQALRREKSLRFTLETVNGQPVGHSALVPALREARFSRVPRGYSWDR